jgi:hypothetical protein
MTSKKLSPITFCMCHPSPPNFRHTHRFLEISLPFTPQLRCSLCGNLSHLCRRSPPVTLFIHSNLYYNYLWNSSCLLYYNILKGRKYSLLTLSMSASLMVNETPYTWSITDWLQWFLILSNEMQHCTFRYDKRQYKDYKDGKKHGILNDFHFVWYYDGGWLSL